MAENFSITSGQSRFLRQRFEKDLIPESLDAYKIAVEGRAALAVITEHEIVADPELLQYLAQIIREMLTAPDVEKEDVSIKEMGLNVKIVSVLTRVNIHTLGDLVAILTQPKARDNMLAIPKFGPESLKAILANVFARGVLPIDLDSSLDQFTVQIVGQETLIQQSFPQERIDQAWEIINRPKKTRMDRSRVSRLRAYTTDQPVTNPVIVSSNQAGRAWLPRIIKSVFRRKSE